MKFLTNNHHQFVPNTISNNLNHWRVALVKLRGGRSRVLGTSAAQTVSKRSNLTVAIGKPSDFCSCSEQWFWYFFSKNSFHKIIEQTHGIVICKMLLFQLFMCHIFLLVQHNSHVFVTEVMNGNASWWPTRRLCLLSYKWLLLEFIACLTHEFYD